MKYCNDFAALLDLFVDGELDAEEMLRVQEHLDACPGCRAYVDAAFAMRAAFPDAEDTIIPDGFTESVMAAVRLAPRKAARKTPWVKILTPIAACCAIVILLQSGSMMGRSDSAGGLFAAGKAAPESAAFDMFADTADMAQEEAETEPAAEGDAIQNQSKTEAPGVDGNGAFTYPVEPGAQADSAGPRAEPNYATILYLPSECIDLLADVKPLQELDDAIHFELDAEACEALQAQLKDRDIFYAVGCGSDPTTDAILVVVAK